MKWSWKIGSYAGIGVYIHATFLLLIGFVVLTYWLSGDTVEQTLWGIVFTLALFLCVVLHEFGHALTAQRYGIRTRDITLLPIGGVARLEKMPDEPIQEFWVAVAGPAVNVVLAVGLLAVLLVTGTLQPLSELSITDGSFIERLMAVNVFLVAFNLIPAFPMDGGRILRALLATRLEYTRATSIAASLGQGIALIFGFIGFFTNPFLLFIAFFVWIGAAQEASMTQMKFSLSGIPVERAMHTEFHSLHPEDHLSAAVAHIIAGFQHDFPVVADGSIQGILTRQKLLLALSREGPETEVGKIMDRNFQTVDSSDMLDTATGCLQSGTCKTLPVTHRGQLVGLLTPENVGEFIMIQTALKPTRSPRGGLRLGVQEG